MSVQTQQNVINVLVGANPSPIATATVQITDPSATATYIADGQVVILNHLGAPMQPANANIGDTPYIQFVQRSGTELHFSARIKGTEIVSAKGKSYVASQEQIWTVGYNGSTGSIDASSTEYMFTIVYTFDDMMWSEQQLSEVYEILSNTPTQQVVAQTLSYDINFAQARKLSLGTGAFVSATMLSDGTGTVLTNSRTLAVVNGSDIVTLSGALSTALVPGDILRIGAAALATTDPIYVVIATSSTDSSLSSTQVRIHTYYQGVTGTIANANVGTVASSVNFGVKITGLPLTWVKDFFKFKKVMFHVTMANFGNTTLTKTQESSLGNGTYQLVAEFESFAAGNEGALNRMMVPLPLGRTDTVTGATYDTLQIESVDRKFNAVAGVNGMRYELYVFLPDGATQQTQLLAQLNPYIASTPAALPAVSL